MYERGNKGRDEWRDNKGGKGEEEGKSERLKEREM